MKEKQMSKRSQYYCIVFYIPIWLSPEPCWFPQTESS